MKSMQKLKKFYLNQSMLLKLNAAIVFMTLILSLLFTLFTLMFYRHNVTTRRNDAIRASSRRAAELLDQSSLELFENFTRICGTADFQKELKAIHAHPETVYLHRNNLISVTNELQRMHYLISSVLIVSGTAPHYSYAPYSAPLRIPLDSVFTLQKLSESTGITWYSERSEPSDPTNRVVPLVLPAGTPNHFVSLVNPQEEEPDAYIILFLDAERLQASLANTGLSEYPITYQLVRGDGRCITGNRSADDFQPEPFQAMLQQLNRSGADELYQAESRSHSMLYRLKTPDLFLLCTSVQEDFLSTLYNIGSSIFVAIVMIFFLMLLTTFFMHRYVTQPVAKLSHIVSEIEAGRYDTPQHFHSKDELGQLLEALNRMNRTLLLQKEKIKDEEAQKYHAELRLLTEQINPHFLYNTLEEIQSEVSRQNNDTATSMIQYLADYLRISLSGGSDVIPITNELRHVNAYIKIMNQRFSQSIMLVQRVDPALNSCCILKTILQPLVENSIRHGFGVDATGILTSIPSIEISFEQPAEGCIQLRVCDNGSGFDSKQVLAIMTGMQKPKPHSHVGINNVYRRLLTFYGAGHVRVEASSIPYYQNEIRITLDHISDKQSKTEVKFNEKSNPVHRQVHDSEQGRS